MYSIEFSKLAEKKLSKLSDSVQRRIVSTIERCRVRPYDHIKKLVDSPYFRLRVGDYRVIMDVKDNELIILVITIGHRKNVYKK